MTVTIIKQHDSIEQFSGYLQVEKISLQSGVVAHKLENNLKKK